MLNVGLGNGVCYDADLYDSSVGHVVILTAVVNRAFSSSLEVSVYRGH